MLWLTVTVIWIVMLIVHPVGTAVVTGALLGAYVLFTLIRLAWQAIRGGPW